MRTLALLAAVLLLALQAQAGPLAENAKEAPELQQPKEEELDMTISLDWAGSSDLHHAGRAGTVECTCKKSCGIEETRRGSCNLLGVVYNLCCHQRIPK